MKFTDFSSVIAARFKLMSKHQLYVVDVDKDLLWETYLKSFPEGTNPIYKTNTEYDCNCCHSFIKQLGSVVEIKNNKVKALWDVVVPYPYDVVAKALNELVENAPIKNLFVTSERLIGKEYTIQLIDIGDTVRWDHFHCDIPSLQYNVSPETEKGTYTSNVGVIKRSLEEISHSAASVVLELSNSGALYRGTDNVTKQLQDFVDAQRRYAALTTKQQNCFIWNNGKNIALRIRNTSIGQLLQALTKGEDLETAIAAYERMVAPSNYRRTTALITKGMVDKALATLRTLNLESAIYRRYATVEDVSARDIIWANRDAGSILKDPLEALLAPEIKTPKTSTKDAIKIPVEEFISVVLPTITKLELLFEHKHGGNLVSITTASAATTESLFNWKNDFAWSYRGGVTDSIKERVKAAGGNVTGWGRASLSWWNTDDLDIHAYEPNGALIYHGNKSPRHAQGTLDVDMNVSNVVRDAVENIVWPNKMNMGIYKIKVRNFTKREAIDVGFEVELEVGQEKVLCTYEKAVSNGSTINVAEIVIGKNDEIDIRLSPEMRKGASEKEEWGLQIANFHEVDLITLSPNYWGSSTGLKHWFFLMKHCINPEPTRGFYNEYLRTDLHEHRKVFEILGEKTKCEPSTHQLSGLGFSSTTRNEITVRVDGGRKYTISF